MDGAIPKGQQQPWVELTPENLLFITSVVAAQVADGVVRPRARRGKANTDTAGIGEGEASEEEKMEEASEEEEMDESSAEKKMDEKIDAEES